MRYIGKHIALDAVLTVLRKYGTVIVLALMSIVQIGFFIDASRDAQQMDRQVAIPHNMVFLMEDLDLDELDDEDYEVAICKQFSEDNVFANNCATIFQTGKPVEAKCSLTLLRGQVRRCFPRSCIADSHNYTPFVDNRKWRGFAPCHFFC